MRRREFIAGLGTTALWPMTASGQRARLVVGYLDGRSPESDAEFVRAFVRGLDENGFVDGRNVTVEYRWAHGKISRIPELVAELVERQVSVIVAIGGTAYAAKAATSTIPIVFGVGSDPVASGLVESFNRPNGNATGISTLTSPLGLKRLEQVVELLPSASLIAVLVTPSYIRTEILEIDFRAAAKLLGRQLLLLHAEAERDFEPAFQSLTERGAGALVFGNGPLFLDGRGRLVELAQRYRVPAFYANRESVLAGGLVSYGPSFTDVNRQLGAYVARILKGEKPADLPVQQPSKFELVINLKTAKALGLTIPETLLATADEVIQ